MKEECPDHGYLEGAKVYCAKCIATRGESRIEKDLRKILEMLGDIEKRNKNPQYRELIRKLKKQYEKSPKCPCCGNPTHERDGHHCPVKGEWI
jgi:ribosomal protein L30/L7E